MTKKEEKLIIDALSDISVKTIEMDCPEEFLRWSAKREKELISELGLESQWDKAVSAKGAEMLRKQVEEEAINPFTKAIGMMFVDIIAGMGDDEEEEDDE